MNRFTGLSYNALKTAGLPNPEEAVERLFQEAVHESNLHLWTGVESPPETGDRLLIGTATWSLYDLRLLDVIDDYLSRAGVVGPRVDVFDASRLSAEELRRHIPELGPIHHTPAIGIWRNGVLVETASGGAARDKVARMFGSSSDEIVAFVRSRTTGTDPAPLKRTAS